MSPWRKTHFNTLTNTRGQKSIKQKLYHNAQIIQWSLTMEWEIEIYTTPGRRSQKCLQIVFATDREMTSNPLQFRPKCREMTSNALRASV